MMLISFTVTLYVCDTLFLVFPQLYAMFNVLHI